jgi:hypothetical protein
MRRTFECSKMLRWGILWGGNTCMIIVYTSVTLSNIRRKTLPIVRNPRQLDILESRANDRWEWHREERKPLGGFRSRTKTRAGLIWE